MIRYISQKQVDLNRRQRAKNELSQEIEKKKRSSSSLVPEEDENSSKALKQLKRVNDYKDMLTGRLSVLQIQQEKSDFKAFLSEHRYKFHQQMRDEMQRERQAKADHLKRVYNKLLETQQRARNERQAHNANLRNAQGQLNRNKANDYKQTKEKREEIERSISLIKKEESQLKRQRKQQIKQYQKNQRFNVEEYMKNKFAELKKSDNESVQRFGRVKEERAKQIEQLSKLQSLMIEKQARSRLSSEQSQKKLQKFLGDKKAVSTSHTTKLPPILSPERQLSEDILVL